MLRRFLALLTVVLFLWPAAVQAAVALCAISGKVFNPDGSTLNNGVVQFDSKVTQVVGSTTIPPSIISTTTDNSGNMAPMSLAQGLFGTFTFCQGKSSTNVGGPGGGCAAPINGLIPVNTAGNIQAVIAGTLLPSVGNATVNNLIATNNVNVGGTLETTTLAVDANATVGGTLNTTGALSGPSLTLTANTCSPNALTLAQSEISSWPPDQDFIIVSGAHCTGSGTTSSYVADSNSAVLFGNFTDPSIPAHNGGWQWLGDTGLTAGSAYTPTVRMTLDDKGTLNIRNSVSTAILIGGNSIAAVGTPDINIAAGAAYNGTNWIAQNATATILSMYNAGFVFTMNSGLTPGAAFSPTNIAGGNQNGWTMYGSNPVMILQSSTNAPSDILEVVPQNLTQGIGIDWSHIHSIGTGADVALNLDSKGAGAIGLNTMHVGGAVVTSGPVLVQSNYHLSFANNGALPALTTCSAGTILGVSTDNVGQVNFTAPGATVCAMNFARAWPVYPLCVCSSSPAAGGAAGSCVVAVSSTTANFYFNTAMTGSGYMDYVCMGAQ